MILALSPPCAWSGSKEPWAPGGTSDGGEGAGCDSSVDRERTETGYNLGVTVRAVGVGENSFQLEQLQ